MYIVNYIKYKILNNKKKKKINFYREIPFESDFVLPFYAASKEKIMVKEGLIPAFILKWKCEGKIQLNPISDNNYSIDISRLEDSTHYEEKALIKMLKTASIDGKTLILSEFKQWCFLNSKQIEEWWETVKEKSKEKLKQAGYLREDVEYAIKHSLNSKYIYSEEFLEKLEQLNNLKHFLKNMSSIKTKKIEDVNLWNEYLIYATTFGIANQVNKKLSFIVNSELANITDDFFNILFNFKI
ncbi:MAG: DUF2207 domain-containing protein [Bacilli bacterium]|nr:DUF2207 domain-containing protein [Bacilli bacterium]